MAIGLNQLTGLKMTAIIDSLPTWSPTAVKTYQESLTRQYARGVWHKIDRALNYRWGFAFLLGFLIALLVAFVFWPAARPFVNDAGIGLAFVATAVVFLLEPVIDRWKARQPRWETCSIPELVDLRDIELPPHHPLRRAIADSRTEHHDAEFEAQYLELAEDKRRERPKIAVIWMYPNPFTSTVREPVLVLKDWDTVVSPS